MKQLVKFIITMLIVAAIGYGFYTLLPEYPQAMVKSIIQPHIDDVAKQKIFEQKNEKEKNTKTEYGVLLFDWGNTNIWVYENLEEENKEVVTFYTTGVSINLGELPNNKEIFYSEASVKIEFIKDNNKTKNNKQVIMYINGNEVDKETKNYILESIER